MYILLYSYGYGTFCWIVLWFVYLTLFIFIVIINKKFNLKIALESVEEFKSTCCKVFKQFFLLVFLSSLSYRFWQRFDFISPSWTLQQTSFCVSNKSCGNNFQKSDSQIFLKINSSVYLLKSNPKSKHKKIYEIFNDFFLVLDKCWMWILVIKF